MSQRSRRRRKAPSSFVFKLSKGTKAGLTLIALVVFVAGLYVGVKVAEPPERPDLSRLEAAPPPPTVATPPAQDPPSEPPADPLVSAPPITVEVPRRPRVALVIDDLGRSLQDLETLAALDIPLSYAVLPFERLTEQVVAELRRRKAEILCHLPMEAKSGANPGPGALRLGMTREELATATRQALSAVPGATGVNNHMGSSLSAEREAITAVLEVVRDHGLFYLDSRTTAETLGSTVARQLGVPAGERNVFLDSDREAPAIRGQFDRLLALAEARGSAIAIAHPYRETLEVLATAVPEAMARGFDFVPASAIVDQRPPGATDGR